jgi:polyphenol oxidase
MNVELTPHDSPVGTVYVPANVPPGFALFYTGRDFPGRLDSAATEKLRETLRQLAAIEAPLSTCSQVHGTALAHFSKRESGPWREHNDCDALWSAEKPSALGIKVADCLPVTTIDPAASVVVNVHAGWRGASAGIISTTLESVRSSTSLDPSRSSVFLGPSIRSCCFEVGEEVVEAFTLRTSGFAQYVVRKEGSKPHIDLPAFATGELERLGVAAEQIFDSGICTRCDGRFHSYRRDKGEGGRNLAIAAQ